MSGPEGKQSDRLSDREIRQAEMAQELMGMEMYEEGMGYDQMKEILDVINESRNMAMGGNNSDNRSSQELMEFSPEVTISRIPSKSNSMRNMIVDDNTIPKPTYSYRQASGRASPALSGRRSVLDGNKSPDLFIDDSKRASSERELMDEGTTKDIESGDQEVPMRIRSNLEWPSLPGSSTNSQHNENDKSRTNERRERWRIDPLTAVIDPNDVPLKPRKDNGAEERIPFRFCHEKRAWEEPEVGEKVMAVLSYTLEEAADTWRRSRRPEITEFQWGLPIKVGSNTRNLDKKTVTEDSPTRSRPNMDRNCKRKAVECIKDLINDKTESDCSDEDVFETVKKAKIIDKKYQPLSKSFTNNKERNMNRQDKMFSNMNAAKSQDAVTVGEYDSDEIDNDDLSKFQLRKSKKGNQPRPISPDFVPRRIIPPVPGKAKPRRQAKKNGATSRKSPVRKNALEIAVGRGRGKNSTKPVTLNDDEIMSELDNDAVDMDDVDIEIIPKPIKGLTKRLQMGTSKLVDNKNAEERMKKIKEEEQKRKEQEEKTRKEDIQIQRLRREEEQKKEKEAKEAKIKAKEEDYRKNEAIRDRNRRRKPKQQKEAELLMDDEEIRDAVIRNTDNDEGTVHCPICALGFSPQEIENHAAACDQFDSTDDPGPSNDNEITITNEDDIHECRICNEFTTNDPVFFEDHVNECKNRDRNGAGSSSNETFTVGTSPPRCFLPISKQTGSSINYTEQFPNKNLSSNVTRRRRH